MKRVVITGATGFIGANLARRLEYDNHEVHLIVRPGFKKWRLVDISPKVKFHLLELKNQKAIEKTLKKIKPQWIFHLAAYGNSSSQNSLVNIIETNVVGTTNLLAAAVKSGFESFINIGSSSEYGFKDHAPKEDECLEPNSHYAFSKAFATMLACDLSLKKKLNIITLRPYSVYGPYEEPTRFIPTIIITSFAGKLPPLVDPNIARDYIFVDDFVSACILAAQYKGKERGLFFNVGTGKQTTIKEVVALAKKKLNVNVKPKWGTMPNRIWDTNVWVSNSSLIKSKLGWRPKFTFVAGFLKTVEWFKANPNIYKFYQKKIE